MGRAVARAGDAGGSRSRAAGPLASQWGRREGRDVGLAFRAGSAPAWRSASVVAVELTQVRRRRAQDGLLAAGREARAGPAVPAARPCQGQPAQDLVGGRFSAPSTCPFPRRPAAALGGLRTQVPATVRAELGYQPPQKVEVREPPGPGGRELRGAMPSTAGLSCRPPGPGGRPPLHRRVPPQRSRGAAGTKGPVTAHATEIFHEPKSPDSYCLHLFSAQEAEQVPPWTWGHPGSLSPLALTLALPHTTPTARPHPEKGL